MPDEPAPSDQLQATQLLGQIPFGAIIGAPLKAAVEAQSAAAVACYDFIRKIGFNDKGEVNNVTFSYQRKGTAPEGQTAPQVTVTLTVPVLTMMPLPFIRIESMNLSFKASISAVNASEAKKSEAIGLDGKFEAGAGLAVWKVSASGGISSKKDSTATNSSKYSVEHTIDMSIHAVQDDMPAGLAKLLNIMTDSISVSPALQPSQPVPQPQPPPQP
jgi:Protein of unknown function (DUF2589)